MVTLPASLLAALYGALERDRGPAAAAATLREVGFETGGALLESVQARAAAGAVGDLPAARFWEHLSATFREMGWGALEVEEPHPGVVSLRSESWAEAEGRASAQPCCHLTTGLLADLLSRVAGADLAAMEVECRAAGDPHCRFMVGGPGALQRVYEELSGGRAYSQAVAALG